MLFLLRSILVAVVLAEQSGKDPIKDVCRRHLQQTCVIDSKLYIDGGLVYYGGSKDDSTVADPSRSLRR
jgi:transcription elongation factor GreA-like protein